MAAGTIAPTTPYCRACGWDFVNSPNLDDDQFCDACGDDLLVSIGPAVDPPTLLAATAASLSVSFAWTDNVAADTTDFRSSIDGAAWVVVSPDTSPTVIAALEGEEVCGQVRSVTDGVAGPWSASDCATALA